MTRKKRWWTWDKRSVKRLAKAAEGANRRAFVEAPQHPTAGEEAISRPCTSDFEAYGAVCPDGGECLERLVCMRWARRQALILAARAQVLTARAGE